MVRLQARAVFLLVDLCVTSVQATGLYDALKNAGAGQFAARIQANPDAAALYTSNRVQTVFAPIDSDSSSNSSLTRRQSNPKALQELLYHSTANTNTLGSMSSGSGAAIKSNDNSPQLGGNPQVFVSTPVGPPPNTCGAAQALVSTDQWGNPWDPHNPDNPDHWHWWWPWIYVTVSVSVYIEVPVTVLVTVNDVSFTTIRGTDFVTVSVSTTEYTTEVTTVHDTDFITIPTTKVTTVVTTAEETSLVTVPTTVATTHFSTFSETRSVTKTTTVPTTVSTTVPTTVEKTSRVTDTKTVSTTVPTTVEKTSHVTDTKTVSTTVPTTVEKTSHVTDTKTVSTTVPTTVHNTITTKVPTVVSTRLLPTSTPGLVKISSGLGNKVNIISGDIPYDGGIIQLIDSSFTLPESLIDTANANGQTAFTGLANSYNQTNTLNNSPDITYFIPNNAALALKDSTKNYPSVEKLLLGHMIPNFAGYLPSLDDGRTYRSQGGSQFTVSIRGNDYYVNNAKIVLSNVVLENGVAHVIDQVIKPNPTPTKAPKPNAAGSLKANSLQLKIAVSTFALFIVEALFI